MKFLFLFPIVITYRQGTDERANRALDILQSTFRCCGSDGRLSYQNNVPLSCNMFSVGCLPRTMFFLDSCMDALAAMLLLFSLIKLLIIIFFYSFLCVHHRHRQKHPEIHHSSMNESNRWRHSSSFDSSSTDNIPKKILLPSPMTKQDVNKNHEDNFIEKRRVILNDYDSQSPNKRVQNAPTILSPPTLSLNNNLSTPSYEQQALRKLSSISEKTEKTETDDSEPDLLRVRQYNPKRKAIITAVNQKQPPPLPKKLPTIKNRRRIVRDDENDNDSGISLLFKVKVITDFFFFFFFFLNKVLNVHHQKNHLKNKMQLNDDLILQHQLILLLNQKHQVQNQLLNHLQHLLFQMFL